MGHGSSLIYKKKSVTTFFLSRFSVKLSQATKIHGHGISSQSGCKLIAYTNIGMAHVISYLLGALVIYTYMGVKSSDFAKIDAGLRKHLGWFVMATFILVRILQLQKKRVRQLTL
jgi:predicted transporter